jgi:hypothetical protein
MLIALILTIGCTALLLIGAIISSWAGADMSECGPDIKNIIMFLAGIGILVFACFCIAKSSNYYHEKENASQKKNLSIKKEDILIILLLKSQTEKKSRIK